MPVETIHTDYAPPPAGHYAQACRAGDLLFVSGQLGIAPDSDPAIPVERQAERVLDALAAIAGAAGAALHDVAKVTVYVTDIGDWPTINAIYASYFGAHRPARAIVPVPALHYGAKIELEAVVSLPFGP